MRYIIAALLTLFTTFAQAQAPTRLCFSSITGDTRNCVPVDAGNPLPTSSAGGTAATLAPGSVAAGAYLAGAFSIGAGIDGWNATEGFTTDPSSSVGGIGTISAKLRLQTTQLNTINTSINSALPAFAATNFNTCGAYTTGVTNPVCMDLTGNLYTNTSINRWGGGTLGAMANYGTSPGVVLVPGINAFVTNSLTVQPLLSGSTTLQSAAVANGNGTDLEVENAGGAVLHVVCSVACAGGTTVNFEVSFDGTTYTAIQGTPIGGGAPVSTTVVAGDFGFNVAGYSDLRSRISSYGSGTITVTGFATGQSALQPWAKFTTDQTTPGTTDLVHAKVCDQATSTTCASVKPASTPSVATDNPIVVDMHPNCGACIVLGPAVPAASLPFVSAGFTYTHITTATTTTPKSTAGVLHTVCVNSLGTVASAITVDDALTATTPTIAVINSLALLGCVTYDVAFSTGLTLVTTGTVAPDVTVSWR